MLSTAMKNILIVGCGVTGSATAAFLSSELNEKCRLSLWDKSRGAGGRMATSRSPHDDTCTADLGAQYISTSPEGYKKNEKLYEDLVKSNTLKPFEGVIEGDNRHSEGTRHFIPPHGVSSLVKYFLQKADASVDYCRHVSEVTLQGDKVLVSTVEGYTELFDSLILTQPAPQILQLKGDFLNTKDTRDVVQKLKAVEYSSRFAMALFYDQGTQIELPWVAKYLSDPIVRFVAVDSAKRGRGEVAPSVVVHTTVPFGLEHLEGDTERVCPDLVLPRVLELVPQLPTPRAVKNHKWRYSQVYRPYEGTPGCVVGQQTPLILYGGDSFSTSKFDGCLLSARKLTDTVKEALNT